MARIKDLTGNRYGMLVAVEPTDKRQNGSVVWQCKCDCGNDVLVTSRNLQTGYTTSCGCIGVGRKPVDITGQRFGKLVAVRPTKERRGHSAVWECKCDCGNTAFVKMHNLTFGYTSSCGCIRPGPKADDLTGRRYGRLVVIRPTKEKRNGKTVWECKCDCGKTTFVTSSNLQGNHVKSCGCSRSC